MIKLINKGEQYQLWIKNLKNLEIKVKKENGRDGSNIINLILIIKKILLIKKQMIFNTYKEKV